MRNSTLVMPPQKPISELNPPRKWAYFDLADGTVDSTSTVIANDSRATLLNDFAISGTLGTFWSDSQGYARPNGSVGAQLTLANNPNLEDICEYNGKTVLIAFSFLTDLSSASDGYLLFMGAGSGPNIWGMSVRKNISSPGRFTSIFYASNGSTQISATSPSYGDLYTISGIDNSVPTSPVITTSAAHSLKVGHWVYLSTTDTTPDIAGMHQVTAVGSATTFTIATAAVTNVGTQTGDVGVEAYAFLAIDGVSGTMQWFVIQKGTTDIASGTIQNLPSGSGFNQGSNVNLTLFDRRQLDDALGTGQFRRMLIMNYGAKTVAQALPTLTSGFIQKLAASDMVPSWELED